MIVISRIGGEGADLATDMGAVIDGSWKDGTSYKDSPYDNNSTEYDDYAKGETYMELSKSERDMVKMVCSKFSDVIVVYNGANTLELGWVDDYAQIKSVLWCPGTGQSGFNALGEILRGTVNPSGKTADTFVYDLTKTPTFNNIGCFVYDNMEEHIGHSAMFGREIEVYPSFVNYVEGIYVGYRFYETAAAEGFLDYDNPLAKVQNTNASGVLAMRTAAHNMLYTVVNSRAYAPENLNPGMEGWQIALVAVDVALAALLIALEVTVIRKGYQKRKHDRAA